MRRIPVALAAAALLTGSYFLVSWVRRDGAASSAYATVPVDRGPITARVTATGTVNPVKTVQVGTYVVAVRDWPVGRGRFFTSSEEDSAAKVAVLDQTIVDKLFVPGEDPLGASVRIRGIPFRVIGVLAAKGQTTWGQDQDDVVVVPFNTAERGVLGTAFLGSVNMPRVRGEPGRRRRGGRNRSCGCSATATERRRARRTTSRCAACGSSSPRPSWRAR